MDRFAVDPGELHCCDAVLGGAADAARGSLAEVRAAADNALAAWHGSASAAFRSAWEEWCAGVRVMIGALDEMAAALGSAGDAYAGTEHAVRVSLVRAGS